MIFVVLYEIVILYITYNYKSMCKFVTALKMVILCIHTHALQCMHVFSFILRGAMAFNFFPLIFQLLLGSMIN